MKTITTTCFLFFLSLAATGQVRYVDPAAGPGGDGKSWSTAFNKLGPALAAATSGTILWVAQGTYSGGFTVPAGVTLLGGFEPGDRRVTQRRPHHRATILDGGRTQRVVNLLAGSVLDGFTVRNGRATTFEGGGGALVDGVSATITDCLFTGNANTAGRAAALHIRGGGNLRLHNTVFYKNEGSGHVIDFTASSGVVTHIVVHDNVSNGLHFHAGSSPRIYNSVFSANSGRGLCHISASDQPVLRNNLLFGNQIALYHYRGQDLQTLAAVNNLAYASGNLAGDPRFLAPAALDFRIAANSAGLDAGVGTIAGVQPSATDIYGNGRHLDGDLDGSNPPDLGAAEYGVASLQVGGTMTRGGSFAITLNGTGVTAGLLFIGVEPGAIRVDPLGWFGLDPMATLVAVPVGLGPVVQLPIPNEVPAGTGLVFQGLAWGAMGGSFTGARDVRVK